MARPHIYRDTPLYWFMGFASTALALVHFLSSPAMATETMEITFAGSCCDGFVCSAAAAKAGVGANGVVRRSRSDSETTLTLTTPKNASPRQLWEALENIQRRPLRLVSGEREFVSKPPR